jgi:hypothetical protein
MQRTSMIVLVQEQNQEWTNSTGKSVELFLTIVVQLVNITEQIFMESKRCVRSMKPMWHCKSHRHKPERTK